MDLLRLQREIAEDVAGTGSGDTGAMLASWEQRNAQALERAQRLPAEFGDV